ncbi:MAG: DUF4349 domain-containing protein [Bacillota bacterium]
MQNQTPMREPTPVREPGSQDVRERGVLLRKVTLPGFLVVLVAVFLVGAIVLVSAVILTGVAPGRYTMPSVGSPDRGRYIRELPAAATIEERAEPSSAGSPGASFDAVMASSGVASASGLDQIARKVIKDANLSVEVSSFKDGSSRAAAICEAQGGYIQSSSAQASKGDLRSGTIVLRVPADKFEAVLRDVENLGKVRSKEVAGRDVTEEYVDLEARLSNWQQQEKQLLVIMGKASKVSDVLQVQAELGRVREEIERITGRLKYLNSQIAFSTIRVELFEPSVASEVPHDWGFVRAVERAIAAFVNTVNAIVVFAGGIAPVAVLALAAWGVAAGVRRRRAR